MSYGMTLLEEESVLREAVQKEVGFFRNLEKTRGRSNVKNVLR